MCVYAHLPRIGMFRGSMGGMARDGNSSAKCGKPIGWSMSCRDALAFFPPFKSREKKPESLRELCEEPDRMFSKKVLCELPHGRKHQQNRLFSITFVFVLFSLKRIGTQYVPFYGQKIFVCALCLFKPLLWILMFFDFKKQNKFAHSNVSKKKNFCMISSCSPVFL